MCCPHCQLSWEKLKKMKEEEEKFPTTGGQSFGTIYNLNENPRSIVIQRSTGNLTRILRYEVLKEVHDMVHEGKLYLNTKEIDDYRSDKFDRATWRWGIFIGGLLKKLGCAKLEEKQTGKASFNEEDSGAKHENEQDIEFGTKNEVTKNRAKIKKEIFAFAKKYLLSFESVDEALLNKYLDLWKDNKPDSIADLYAGILHSSSNKQGMPRSIGKIKELKPYLEDFYPDSVLKRYDGSWENLFDTIGNNYKPPGRMVKSNQRNYWVIFCKSAISSSLFLSKFSTLEEFNNFVSQFYLNEYTQVALPLLLSKEIYGLGFALACDFLKENGYPEFVKPDTHIKAIFKGLRLTKGDSDYDVFKDVVKFSNDIGELPYSVDKVFWLIGSGRFYKDDIIINSDRDTFIDLANEKFRGLYNAQRY